jgi:hypothetical protein
LHTAENTPSCELRRAKIDAGRWKIQACRRKISVRGTEGGSSAADPAPQKDGTKKSKRQVPIPPRNSPRSGLIQPEVSMHAKMH